MKVLVLLASGSKANNTYKLCMKIFSSYNCKIILLQDYKINFFDIKRDHDSDDQFLEIIHMMSKYDLICCASPVYWYVFSAQLKVFLDRLSDMVYFSTALWQNIQSKPFVYISIYANDPGYGEEIFKKICFARQLILTATLMVKNLEITDEEVIKFQQKCINAVAFTKEQDTY